MSVVEAAEAPRPEAAQQEPAPAPVETRVRQATAPSPDHEISPPVPTMREHYVMTYEKMGDIDALHAQMASWDPRLVTGTHTPRLHVGHPEELPSQRIPASLIAHVVQTSGGRFRVCRTAGLPHADTDGRAAVRDVPAEVGCGGLTGLTARS